MRHVDAEKLALDLWDYIVHRPSYSTLKELEQRVFVLKEMRARSEHYDFAPERKVGKNPAFAAPYKSGPESHLSVDDIYRRIANSSQPPRPPLKAVGEYPVPRAYLNLFEDAI